ncbi:MAG TPA: hypothetical protein VFS41_04000 [Edaphobacter sp.]|nr:hypothetical protein [Edaphobacter sp.]
MVRLSVVFAVFSAVCTSVSLAQTESSELTPALTGYVTRVASNSDFDVNAIHVIQNSKTEITHGSIAGRTAGGSAFLGEQVSIYGRLDARKQTIQAKEIIFLSPRPDGLSGTAVIDRLLTSATNGQLLFRADGYLMQVHSSTKQAFSSPLTSLKDVQPNTWITYHGTLDASGHLTLDAITFSSNAISDREGKLLEKTDYDPSKVPPDSKQSVASKVLIGFDPKKVPPYDDPAMQERISRIGTSLIPAYQRSLAPQDPTRIDFQFQVIDEARFHDALALPSGVILVPQQVVKRLQNDSQIATVLADNIACVLEKQGYRLNPAVTTMTAVNTATVIGGLFVPGLGLTPFATGAAGKSIQTDLENQSGRVSLGLLHDAGYDLEQAPIAWWILASKPSHDWKKTKLPPRASNLYRTIGLVWKNYPDTAAGTNSSTTTSSTN